MNKKIIFSLAVIGVVTGIVVGFTGAWWTDEAVSSNTSFNTGTMELQLANTDEEGNRKGAWQDDEVTQTWDYENMYPGADSVGGALLLRNSGTTPADWLKFETAVNSSDGNLSNVMRITKLDYNGESLLEGGAGAIIPEYEGPAVEDCDVLVDGEHGGDEYTYIQSAVDNAEDGDLVCVRDGHYNETVVIDTENVTLASLNGPSAVTIEAAAGENYAVDIREELGDITVKGFTVLGGKAVGIAQSQAQSKGTATHVLNNVVKVPDGGWTTNGNTIQVSGDNSTVIGNKVEITGYDHVEKDWSTYGIMVIHASNAEVKHNHISYVDKGVGEFYGGIVILGYSNGINADNNLIEHNTVIGAGAGISLQAKDSKVRNTIIEYNIIQDNNIGISVLETGVSNRLASDTVANWNNIVDNEVGIDAEDHDGWFNARYNWWGDYTPSEHVEGDVDTSDYLGGPHVGFINGNDQNDNGFADLNDMHYENILVENPDLGSSKTGKFDLRVQLDGPKSNNDDQGQSVALDVTVTMGQGPVTE